MLSMLREDFHRLPQGVTPHDFGALMSRHADDSWISLDDDVSVRNRSNVGNENLLLLCREALKDADKNGVVDTFLRQALGLLHLPKFVLNPERPRVKYKTRKFLANM